MEGWAKDVMVTPFDRRVGDFHRLAGHQNQRQSGPVAVSRQAGPGGWNRHDFIWRFVGRRL